MVKNLHYDLISADLDYDVHEHPQQVVRELGLHVVKAEPFPIGDCWIFRVDNADAVELPGFITFTSDDFKFSDELNKDVNRRNMKNMTVRRARCKYNVNDVCTAAKNSIVITHCQDVKDCKNCEMDRFEERILLRKL